MSKEGTVAPKERINIKYRSEHGGAQESIELPFKMMVVGDFTQRQDDRVIEERKPINVDKVANSPEHSQVVDTAMVVGSESSMSRLRIIPVATGASRRVYQW